MTRKIRVTGEVLDVAPRLRALERTLREIPGLAAAYIYGSYGTPSQTPLSDLDLALVFAEGCDPSPQQVVELIGRVCEALREDDVSVTVLNHVPLAFQYKVLAEGRRLLLLDEIAHADFVERTVTRYSDFAVDEQRFLEEYDRALVEEYCGGTG
jgi:predicted nucleotidyltransferase